MFQRMMDRIFGDLPFCFVYLDDILVFSSSLPSTSPASMASPANWKCVYTASQIEYLGHLVSSSGSAPFHKHVSAITAFLPIPPLQRFLGMVNLSKMFILGAALILRPLTDALHGDPKDFSCYPLWTPPASPPSLPWL